MAKRRAYTLKRRAEQQEETRRRITEATAALHEEVGPARTTISAIAERAGVERLTIYRHFPDERDLLQACQQHYLSAHPYPDPMTWARIDDPEPRLRAALTALYVHYRETEAMTANVLRDAPLLPALAELIQGMPQYYLSVRDILARGWIAPGEPSALLLAAIGHSLEFETWRSLVRRQGLSEGHAIEVMVRVIGCLATRRQAADDAARPRGE